MSGLWTSPRFFAGKPDILHVADALSFSLPLMNRGTASADNVLITDITLDSASRLLPAELPINLGNLALHNMSLVNARFDNSGLVYGAKHAIAISGTYESRKASYRFAVDRLISIPAIVTPPVKFLNARVGVAKQQGLTSYTLFNDEMPGSPHHINAFSLEIVSPASSIGAPKGWAVETDHRSYVLWFTQEEKNQHHVRPGSSVEGFEVRSAGRKSKSRAFTVASWDHEHNAAGPVYLGALPLRHEQ